MKIKRWRIPGGWLASAACAAALGCHSVPTAGQHPSQGYIVEVRCHTASGLPISNVRITNPESGATGLSDTRGKLSFRLEGYEGTEVMLKVDALPEGITLVEDSGPQRLVLKSIASPSSAGGRRPLIHDILLRKNKETYVVLVAAEGAPYLPVKANGILVGKLNSRGAGAFRFQGQPGEELKVVLDSGTSDEQPAPSLGAAQHTFTLPSTSSILSFHSHLTVLAHNTVVEPPRPLIRFREHHRRHSGSRRHHQVKETTLVTQKPRGPVQVPFRDIDLQKR